MAVSNANYVAWDEKKTVECQCDPGYTGADCSLRKCPQGTDPIATVYINDHSVWKIQWTQQSGKKWGEQAGFELPNGQVHWTISYKDDYGDVWTTSAVTTYYQLHTAKGSLVVGPSNKDDALTATPFFMDPDYDGQDKATVSVDGGLAADGSKGVQLGGALGLYEKSVSVGGQDRDIISFQQSFIGEQVNASIQALPNDVVRHSYVHTVFNYGKDQDQVYVYPSMGVPKFKTELKDTHNLAAGKVAGEIKYATGSGVCSPDHAFLTASGVPCANIGKFANGKSVAVNDVRYRFPYFIDPTDTTKGIDALAAKYTNCAKNNLCVFITIPEPVGTKEMNVNYKFKTMIRTLKNANPATEAYKPNEYEVSWAREHSNRNNQPNSLVTVSQVGSDRTWHKLIDGTPVIKYNDNQELKDCSRRGLCDFETGKCKCFDGYSGYKCQERSVLGY